MRKKTIVSLGTGAEPKHDFGTLFEQYPSVIASIQKQTFTSHEFILKLAQDNQKAYIEALHAYRDSEPFRNVHSFLARHLHTCPEVELVNTVAPSANIFGEADTCAVWKRKA